MPLAMMIKRLIAKYYFAISFILGCFYSINATAQNDFESWNCISADFKINSKSGIGASTEIRLNNNALGFKKYLVDVGYDYKILKRLKASISYRYTRFNDLDAFKNEHQVFGCFEYSKKLDRLTVSFQSRYQRAFEVLGWTTKTKTEDYWRNKLSANYNIYQSPLAPFASYELFTETSKFSNIISDKYRLFLGCKYKLSNANTLAVYYGVQKSLLKTDNSYILGLKYSFSFEREMQKDDDE
jgi:hypothetical protein